MFSLIFSCLVFLSTMVSASGSWERDVDFAPELRRLLNFDSRGYLVRDLNVPSSRRVNSVSNPQTPSESNVYPIPTHTPTMSLLRHNNDSNSSASNITVFQKSSISSGYVALAARPLKSIPDRGSVISSIMNSLSVECDSEIDYLRRIVYILICKYKIQFRGSSNSNFYSSPGALMACLRSMLPYHYRIKEYFDNDRLVHYLRTFTEQEIETLRGISNKEAHTYLKALF